MRLAVLSLVFLAMAAAVLPAQGDEENDTRRAFYRGNDLFESGDFEAAADAYRQAIEEGATSPALHFNFGNACLRLGRVGHAIHQFRLAQRLAPRDGDIAANLKVAHERAGLAAPEERRGILRLLLFAHERLTLREALICFAAFWFLGFILLHTRAIWRRPRGLVVPALCLLVGAALFISLFLRSQEVGEQPRAIVVAPTVAAWSGRSEESFGKLFELPEGQEVEVLEEDEEWFKIAASERKGYVRRSLLRKL
jgi:tetratricopeptide (TPR) repeat protein